jgi:murein L,D-transpeptidase YafK
MRHSGGNVKQRYFVAAFTLIAAVLLPGAAVAGPFEIEISKNSQMLLVKEDGQTIRTFHVAYGRGGAGGKAQLGDNKTPVGVYRITEFKSDSRFYYFMLLDYPSLLDAWRGYQNNLINATQFREIATAHRDHTVPPQNTALGGYIGIHGIGDVNKEKLELHDLFNWTEGCIALKNEEINELRQYVTIGTRVIITE